LLDAGASPRILEEIKLNPLQALYFTYPNNGDVTSHFFTVEGWTKTFPDKHLWLFVHPKGASDWLPQDEEVQPDADGNWMHNVYVGRAQDCGLDFEIKAAWVDSESNRKLKAYFQLRCKSVKTEYPDNCPGIRLPQGNPTAQVAIIRWK
jgi:hypothetical protein